MTLSETKSALDTGYTHLDKAHRDLRKSQEANSECISEVIIKVFRIMSYQLRP